MVDTNDCWIWNGGLTKGGYGQISYKGESHLVHRLFFFLQNNIWSTRQKPLDHLCRVRRCANPIHLELVTSKLNSQRGETGQHSPKKLWTHCINGHEFTPENTRRYGNQGRKCLACKAVRDKAYRLKNVYKLKEYKREWWSKNKGKYK